MVGEFVDGELVGVGFGSFFGGGVVGGAVVVGGGGGGGGVPTGFLEGKRKKGLSLGFLPVNRLVMPTGILHRDENMHVFCQYYIGASRGWSHTWFTCIWLFVKNRAMEHPQLDIKKWHHFPLF